MARGRIPRPWLRASTGRWMVTLDGRQVDLGSDKRAAHAEFARLMTLRGSGKTRGRLLLRDLAELWLTDAKRRIRPATRESYTYYSRVLVEFAGALEVRDLRPHHISEWVERFKADSTKHLAISVAKMIVAWGLHQGYLDADPIARLKKPPIARRAPVSKADLDALLRSIHPVYRVVLTFQSLSGVRPGELCSMRIEHCRVDRVLVNGKSGERWVMLSRQAQQILAGVIGGRKSGPVWHTAIGTPLTRHTLTAAVARARGKLSHVCSHGLRGLFATELLRAGADGLIVAALLGHSSPAMLAKHYANLEDEGLMREALEKGES